MHHHETTYRAIQQFIEKPPGKLRIFGNLSAAAAARQRLAATTTGAAGDYKTGRQCGRYFPAVGKLLADQPPLLRHAPRIANPRQAGGAAGAGGPMKRPGDHHSCAPGE
ncbi:DUF6363 domain-containing protein [Klebsiella pneumoniae subsp. pneumoniae]|nr:DUF6363 domain-containing protein [Klebsiella pneumoniae subsp. pneumoniae]